MPFGTRAPSSLKRFGSERNSTTSRSSSFVPSTPAMSSQVMPLRFEALISCGFVFGITFSIRNMT